MSNFYVELIGTIAAVLTTGSFVPQVYKTWKTKDAKSLSLPMVLLLFLGVCLWITYGFLIMSIPILAANIVTALCVGILVYFKLTFK